jgi:hypothetical protein
LFIKFILAFFVNIYMTGQLDAVAQYSKFAC